MVIGAKTQILGGDGLIAAKICFTTAEDGILKPLISAQICV
jgi:hypothetical protein